METINVIRHDPSELKEDEHGLLICLSAAFGKKWICEANYYHEKETFFHMPSFEYKIDQVLWFIRKSELIEAKKVHEIANTFNDIMNGSGEPIDFEFVPVSDKINPKF